MLDLIGVGGHVFGIAFDYLAGAALVAAGIYVLGLVRLIGVGLIAAGVFIGAVAYGKTLGAADCIAAGRLAAVETKLAAAERDLAAARLTDGLRTRELADLAERRVKANEQIEQWQAAAARFKDAARGCRTATRDDDRRLCAIVGNKAAGCRAAR